MKVRIQHPSVVLPHDRMYTRQPTQRKVIVHALKMLCASLFISLFASAFAGCAASPQPESSLTLRRTPSTDAFVTVWRTDKKGDVLIPTGDGRYLYDVDWDNDGVFEERGLKGDAHHHYGDRQTVTIRIRGRFDHLQAGRLPNCLLLAVKQWGDIKWRSAREMFSGCANLVALPSTPPNFRMVRSISHMFSGAIRFNEPLNHWDTSAVEDMSGVFRHAQHFNQPLHQWDTTNTKNMSSMFVGAIRFNQPLNAWNTAQVTTMSRMFQDAYAFNQPLELWDTAHVRDMSGMFAFTKQFNQPLNTWNIRSLQATRNMFRGTEAFTMPLDNWDLLEINDTTDMFKDARKHPMAPKVQAQFD